VTRIALLVLHALVAVSAIGGAIWVVPTMPLDWIKAGPFTDWTVPALALGLVGVLAAVSFVAVLRRPWLGALASVVAGAAMIAFELVEIGVVGWTPRRPPTERQLPGLAPADLPRRRIGAADPGDRALDSAPRGGAGAAADPPRAGVISRPGG
jgi:hypothetical protein